MVLEFKDFNICLVTDGSSMDFHDEDYEHINSDYDPMDFLLRVPEYLMEKASDLGKYKEWMAEVGPTLNEIIGSVSTYQKQFEDVYLSEDE